MAGDVSPTSSRKIVPPSASSNRPLRSAVAPVKAPRAWPNSSDSSSVSGRAPQFWATNGRSRGGCPLSWMSRANSSLPVPVSPSSSTVVSRVEHLAGQLDGLAEAGRRADQPRRTTAASRASPPPRGGARCRPARARRGAGRSRARGVSARGAAHHDEQLVRIPGLGDEVVDAAGVDRRPSGCRRRCTRSARCGPRRARAPGSRRSSSTPVMPGHAVVGDDDRHVRLRGEPVEGLLAADRPAAPGTRRRGSPRARRARAARRPRSGSSSRPPCLPGRTRHRAGAATSRLSQPARPRRASARCRMPLRRGRPSSR